ncbi:hypothetical protein [Snuella sedimenti]|uniref:Uncharacterized protein n=1 Tax=Snuella sedimenti TaxID=2798802 RepID=A0A8J7J3B2_9FLAO|nr:hypothetical protein [Snuella sedimenti]MBJ6368977.1 hypothetical protein [Snuella sedimenti]
MKSKVYFLTLVGLLYCFYAEAQLLEKLKERAKEKGIQTSEDVKYDSTAYDPNLGPEYDETEELHLNAAKDFFNKDVIMALYNDGQLVQTAFFDSEVIAMRTEQVNNEKPIYHDDTGKFYAYNNEKGYYETMKLLPSSSMGFMTAGLTTQVYKLPQQPYFEAFKALESIGSGLNFLILEMAFIYKPDHFNDSNSYTPEKVPCNGSENCIRFNYNFPDYPGSYIQFDDQDRLSELYINSTNPQFKDEPKGKFVFTYKECTVKIPDAVEQSIIPGPLGKLLPLEKGLEPWKHNKKDKQKK